MGDLTGGPRLPALDAAQLGALGAQLERLGLARANDDRANEGAEGPLTRSALRPAVSREPRPLTEIALRAFRRDGFVVLKYDTVEIGLRPIQARELADHLRRLADYLDAHA